MITMFKGFFCKSRGYDITSGEDDAAKWVRGKISMYSELVNDYLLKKNQTKYYPLGGESFITEPGTNEGELVYFYESYTDKECELISSLLIDYYNNVYDKENRIPYDTNILELCNDMPLHETKGYRRELDELIHERANENGIIPLTISMNFCYLYRFTVSFYSIEDSSLLCKKEFKYYLKEDDYKEMVVQQLLLNEQFTYNRLVLTHPHIAQYLTEKVLDWSVENLENPSAVFTIEFTEVMEDAKSIQSELDE